MGQVIRHRLPDGVRQGFERLALHILDIDPDLLERFRLLRRTGEIHVLDPFAEQIDFDQAQAPQFPVINLVGVPLRFLQLADAVGPGDRDAVSSR